MENIYPLKGLIVPVIFIGPPTVRIAVGGFALDSGRFGLDTNRFRRSSRMLPFVFFGNILESRRLKAARRAVSLGLIHDGGRIPAEGQLIRKIAKRRRVESLRMRRREHHRTRRCQRGQIVLKMLQNEAFCGPKLHQITYCAEINSECKDEEGKSDDHPEGPLPARCGGLLFGHGAYFNCGKSEGELIE